ncbi:hypothetical protein HXX76_015067 [Chlamydomonas incerta]|uniref:Uncharacterized protein n=1 Tax=Chlamydomonas incerta TaxID=51695 RepID=A0A835VSH4_CHLIN|nr:hypothetical protein HXX76_015067 [Chlamydomonas incerta]|eukprot:KAG2423791.1 hypothetical protein HXX76_015067 [Chlamydomonas incerta]
MPEGGPQELIGAEARGRHLTLGSFLSLKSSSAPDVNYRFDGSPIYATCAGSDSVIAIDGRVVVHLTPETGGDAGDSSLLVSRIAGGDDEAGDEDSEADVPDGADEQRRDGTGAEARFTFDLRCPAPAGDGVVYVVDGDRIRKLQLAPRQEPQQGTGAAVSTLQLADWEPRAIWGLVHIPPQQLTGASAGGGGCLVFSTDTALYSLALPPGAAAASAPGPLTPQLLAGHRAEPGSADGAGPDARFTSIRIGLALDGDGCVVLLDQHAQHEGHTAIRRVSPADGAVSTLGVLTESFTRPAVLPGSGCLAAIMTQPQRAVSIIDLGLTPPRLLPAASGGGAAAAGAGGEGTTPAKAHARLADDDEEEGPGASAGGSGGHKRRRK